MMGGESAMLSKRSNSLDTYHTYDSNELSHFSECQFLHLNRIYNIYSQSMMQCVLTHISDDPRVQEPLDIDLKWTFNKNINLARHIYNVVRLLVVMDCHKLDLFFYYIWYSFED